MKTEQESDWRMEVILKGETAIVERTISGPPTREAAKEIAESFCKRHGHTLVAVFKAGSTPKV